MGVVQFCICAISNSKSYAMLRGVRLKSHSQFSRVRSSWNPKFEAFLSRKGTRDTASLFYY